ncbi:hypothetical protein C8Q79DRAFT_1011512 [Trametes meyenii]|nr:hypothetical protein C8Q79DRAFT_1011512 [Trametes meyenii]
MSPSPSHSAPGRRVTRSGNSKSHPGLVDRPSSRCTPSEVAATKEAKKAEQEALAKSKKKKKADLAEIELQMKEMEKKQRQIRQEHSKPKEIPGRGKKAAPEVQVPEPVSQHEMRSKSKRKRTPTAEITTTEEESSDEEPPTPSPNDNRSSPLSECGTDDDQGDTVAEKTPKLPKKKARSSGSNLPSRDGTEGSIAGEDEQASNNAEDNLGHALSPRTAPRGSTATSQKSSRIANWASSFLSAALSTLVPRKVQVSATSDSQPSLARTAAVSATPCMLPPTRNDREKPKPRPKGKGKKPERTVEEEVDDRAIEVKREPVSDREMEERGYVETDDEALEALAAKRSPIKHGARLTSEAIVKCEPVDLATPGKPKKASASKRPTEPKSAPATSVDKGLHTSKKSSSQRWAGSSKDKPIEIDYDDNNRGVDSSRASTATGQSKSRSAPRNSDLPDGAHRHNAWRAKFVPTFLKALGVLEDPWGVSDKRLLKILQEIWDAVYGNEIPLVVEINDAIHSLATQRMYEWRCAFGHTAMGTFESFFDACPADFPDTDARRDFCFRILQGGRVFFKDPEGEEKEGLYRSPFVLPGIAAHMDVIQGAVHIPALFPSPIDEYPYGAIGMAAAGAYRVALLWCLRKLAYDSKGNVYAIKALNNNTGKWSNKDSAFSISNFGGKAIQCSRSARKLSIKSLDKLVEESLNLAHIDTSQAPLHAPPELSIDVDFDFAMLTEVLLHLSILAAQLIFYVTSGLVWPRQRSQPMGSAPN